MSKLGQIVIKSFESQVLKKNPWKDPHVRKLPVYLPPSYETSPKRRYPVIWCLTGFTGKGEMMLNLNMFSENLPQRLDRMIGCKKMPEAIVAMPDCMTFLGGSQYLNSPANGRYMDYLCDELVPFVDSSFRTLASRDHRGVVGKSSGGFGAITLGMRRADVFGAAGTHSGDMAFQFGYLPDFPKALIALERYGSLPAFFKGFKKLTSPGPGDFAALNTVAMASCYSPSEGKKQPAIDLPFDVRTGEILEPVWDRWLEWDPVLNVDRYAAELRSLRLLYIDCGTRDEFNLHAGARIMSSKLKKLRIKHVHEEFDGGHMNINHRYDRSLPRLAKALQ